MDFKPQQIGKWLIVADQLLSPMNPKLLISAPAQNYLFRYSLVAI